MIEVENRPQLGRYEIHVDGELAGFAAYETRGSDVAFLHTEIEPRFGGRGLGAKLVAAALDDVRAAGGSVQPYCPFVRSFIADHPGYLDLVPGTQRSAFRLPPAV